MFFTKPRYEPNRRGKGSTRGPLSLIHRIVPKRKNNVFANFRFELKTLVNNINVESVNDNIVPRETINYELNFTLANVFVVCGSRHNIHQ